MNFYLSLNRVRSLQEIDCQRSQELLLHNMAGYFAYVFTTCYLLIA